MNKKAAAILAIACCVSVSGALAYFLRAPATIDINNAFVAGHAIKLLSPVSGTVEAINARIAETHPARYTAFLISDRAASAKVHIAELSLRAAFVQSGRDCLKLGAQQAHVQVRALEAEMADSKVLDARRLAEQGFVSQRFLQQQVLNEKAARLSGDIALIEKRGLETATGDALPSSEELVDAMERLRIALIERQRSSVRVGSPIFVQDVHVLGGQWVAAGTVLATVIPVEVPRIQANIIESQIGGVFLGQRARVTIDGLSGTVLEGVVEAIVPATAATFSPLQRNSADSTWMKVAQRIPVLVRLDGPAALLARVRIGQSAQVQLLAHEAGTAPLPIPVAVREENPDQPDDSEPDLQRLTSKAKSAVIKQLRLPPSCKLFG